MTSILRILLASNAWNPRKWTNTCKKQNFIQVHSGWWHGKSFDFSFYIFRIHEKKQVKFNMFLSFTTFTHLHEIILVKKHKSKELLEKPNQNQRFFPTQPPRALIFTGFRTSAASLFKASPNLSASFWEVGSQDTWTQVGWLQLSWRWRWRWLLHLRVVSPFFLARIVSSHVGNM